MTLREKHCGGTEEKLNEKLQLCPTTGRTGPKTHGSYFSTVFLVQNLVCRWAYGVSSLDTQLKQKYGHGWPID